ncbi:hypothetical protein JOD26_002210 [Limosilactobacillus caviae]|nr:hypothetical protein [Limosilactobacillus caviae]MCD7124508.1 hypothetical protein [Limosilactobacillus caviae]MRH47266.1 hypothetical protein [Limosilactobacillus reuteri]
MYWLITSSVLRWTLRTIITLDCRSTRGITVPRWFFEQYPPQNVQICVGNEKNHGIVGRYYDQDDQPCHEIRYKHSG